ncbi:PBP1A family penicillin-binding protein [Ostreiculturibacter nitratireducens]|uniref:transglycosylase domain-containing protein n=1 Tax=Ostreiculturibacter nitratireducens TaxID=3075226 RepID=UPI0031B578CF
MSGTGGKRPPLVADKRYPSGGTTKPKAARKPAPAKAAKSKAKAAPARRTRAARPKRGGNIFVRAISGFVSLIFRVVWGIGWRVTAIVTAVVAAATFFEYTKLPELSSLLDGRARGSVTMLDSSGKVFAWRGETFGGQITAAHVSPHLKNAVIATEDKRFYSHLGISPRGIAGAIRINLSEGRGPLEGNGGSTITQQVAKLLCLGVAYDPKQWESEAAYEDDCRKGGIWRKIKEVPYAFAMEAKYSKDDILTVYLNRAYLGAGARGFEAAAQRYFGKSANDVSPAEAAMLAGLLKAPSQYAPTNNLKRAQDRAAVVLGLMHEQGYLTDKQYSEAMAYPAELSPAAEAKAGGYFADWVMDSGPAFLTSETTEDVIIRTTLDQHIQQAAEEALAYIFDNKVKAGSEAQAAIVVMSADGAVRAMVGGRKTKVAGAFNRATQAKRQTGSTFKPFVYAAALDMGYTMNDIVLDEPLTIYVPGSGNWSPKNYDKDYRGPITLTTALANSINTATVRISETVGREAVQQVAADFGFESSLADGPALALGVSESTLLEMTGAYAGILNGGSSVRPYGLVELRIQGDDAALIGQGGGIGERVISENAARQLTYMMSRVIEEGTGRRAKLADREAAGKTGTTSASRDAWFIGFTADYVAGVWMGYDDNTPLSGVTGGGLPAEIWHEVMVRVNDGLQPKPLPMIRPGELPGSSIAPAWGGDVYSSGVPGAEAVDGTAPPAIYGPGDEVPDDYVAPQAESQQPGNGRRGRQNERDLADQILIDVLTTILRGN